MSDVEVPASSIYRDPGDDSVGSIYGDPCVSVVISIYGNPCDDIKLHIWGSMCCTNLEGNKEDDVESLRNSRLLIYGDTRHPTNLSKSDIMNRLM